MQKYESQILKEKLTTEMTDEEAEKNTEPDKLLHFALLN